MARLGRGVPSRVTRPGPPFSTVVVTTGQYAWTGTGGAVAGGTAARTKLKVYTGSGGAGAGGAAGAALWNVTLTVTWDQVTGNAGYHVEWGTSPGVYTAGSADTATNANSLVIKPLPARTLYYLRIDTLGDAGQNWSQELVVDTSRRGTWSGSGGALSGGAATTSYTPNAGNVRSWAGTGGASAGGAAERSKGKAPIGAGGATTGGTGTRRRTRAYTPSGGVQTSGGALVGRVDAGSSIHAYDGAGGARTGGVAAAQYASGQSIIRSWAGTGGAVAGGMALAARIKVPVGLGGLQAGGFAASLFAARIRHRERLVESAADFLSHFGVLCAVGDVDFVALHDQPDDAIGVGEIGVISAHETITYHSAVGLAYGDAVNVNGVDYTVQEVRSLDDGLFSRARIGRT